ncbi:MAG TPA: APC family permease [Terriglobales bacterium]|nr:APC family permease [Terriglobales bacterium]
MQENPAPHLPPEIAGASQKLVRGMGLVQSTAVNMLEMIGIGPFITIGVILSAMGGPQAVLGWFLGALFSVCDGMVYAELGAAMPGAGGAYIYFREAFNPRSWGILFSFLFLWETIFVAPLAISAACVGFAEYTHYFFPGLTHAGVGGLAATACMLITLLLYRPIKTVGRMSVVMLVIVLTAVLWVIGSGLIHMNTKLAFDFPANAFHPTKSFFFGLAGATLIAMYNYGGYNNITYLGGEVQNPAKNIPRAIVFSVLMVAVLYLSMSMVIIGTIPWREAAVSRAVVSEFIGKVHGPRAAAVMTCLILAATLGGIFTMILGYSRILFAAGAEGNFFKVFGRVHPAGHFPTVSLLAINVLAIPLCWLSLERLLSALMIIQIVFQFIPQVLAVFAIRRYRKNIQRPYGMWLYPLPALVALVGWIYVAATPEQRQFLGTAVVLWLLGLAAYFLRARVVRSWPFAPAENRSTVPA